MAFTGNAGITFTKQAAQLMPKLSAEPLANALRNLNYLYRRHSPAVLSVAYCTAGNLTRNAVYHIPIQPSADGLGYSFEHRFLCDAATQTITVTVDYCTVYASGATVWTNLYTVNETTAGASVLFTSIRNGVVIPRTAVAIRVQYSAPAVGTRTDHHLLVYPSVQTIVAGVTLSGFVPWDDGALTSAEGFAIHEEFLNRVASSSATILADRKQCAFAFVQEYTATPAFVCSDLINGAITYSLPSTRCYLPNATDAETLNVAAIGVVSAGSPTGCIQLAQSGGEVVTFNADGTLQTSTLAISQGAIGLDTYADLQLRVSNTTGNTASVYAVVAWWAPTADNSDLVNWSNPAQVAASSLLAATADRVQTCAVWPYVGCAHLFDGNTVALSTRYLAARIAPGAKSARFAVSESGDLATPSATFGGHTITGGTMAGKTSLLPWQANDVNGTTPTPAFGVAEPIEAIAVSTKAEGYSTAGFVNGETALQLVTQNTPYTERMSVTYASGFSVAVSRQIEDFESL